MIQRITYEEDLALKRRAEAPDSEKPRFDWASALNDASAPEPNILVRLSGDVRPFSLADTAAMVGEAITDLAFARGETAIFTHRNRTLAAEAAKSVGRRLASEAKDGRAGRALSERELSILIEKALVERKAHDVARSVLSRRSALAADEGEGALAVRVIRRNGAVAPWDNSKVEIAIRRAFLAAKADSEPAAAVARTATETALRLGKAFIDVEKAQDIAQEALMRHGCCKAAEAFILCREWRRRQRDEEEKAALEDRQDAMVVLRMPDGSSTFWEGEELRARIARASVGLSLGLPPERIERELRKRIPTEVDADGLREALVRNARALVCQDAQYDRFCARFELSLLYEETLDWSLSRDGFERLERAHSEGFQRWIKRGVEQGRLRPELLQLDLERLGATIDPSADLDFDAMAVDLLKQRFLMRSEPGRTGSLFAETPQMLWMRVAAGLALAEKQRPEERAIELYGALKARRLCLSPAILKGAGRPGFDLASSALCRVEDNLRSILRRCVEDAAQMARSGVALSIDWTAVRGVGASIGSDKRASKGPLPFLKLHDDTLSSIALNERGRCAGSATLEIWHSDILDFLSLGSETGDQSKCAPGLQTVVSTPSLFMKRLEERGQWTLFLSCDARDLRGLSGAAFESRYIELEKSAQNGEIASRAVPAEGLWRRLLAMQAETGGPNLLFKEACAPDLRREPEEPTPCIGPDGASLLSAGDDEASNGFLGAVSIDAHVKADGNLDHPQLRKTTRIAVRALDNAVTLSAPSTDAADNASRRRRAIGLGAVGLHTALARKGLSPLFGAAEAFADEAAEALAHAAIEASADLALEKGAYREYAGSAWSSGLLPCFQKNEPPAGRQDWQKLSDKVSAKGMRNAALLAFGMAKTESALLGVSAGLAPESRRCKMRRSLAGDFPSCCPLLVEALKERGLWGERMMDDLKYYEGDLSRIPGMPEDLRERFPGAADIGWEPLLAAAARAQRWIDQAVALRLDGLRLESAEAGRMQLAAWRAGLKTAPQASSAKTAALRANTPFDIESMRAIAPLPDQADAANPAQRRLWA